MEEIIRDFHGRILAKVETDGFGNKTIRDFHGKILGKYDKASNTTRNFHGAIIARGDATGMLINPYQ